MKDPLIVSYIAERADLLSRVSAPAVDQRHAEAFIRLRDHLRELYRVFRSDFGAVTLERIQNLTDIHEGRAPTLTHVTAFDRMQAIAKILASDYKRGDELKASVAADLSKIVEAQRAAERAREAEAAVTARAQRQVSRVRTPVCWHCHRQLDNRMAEECPTCGWIICQCGACDSQCSRRKS